MCRRLARDRVGGSKVGEHLIACHGKTPGRRHPPDERLFDPRLLPSDASGKSEPWLETFAPGYQTFALESPTGLGVEQMSTGAVDLDAHLRALLQRKPLPE